MIDETKTASEPPLDCLVMPCDYLERTMPYRCIKPQCPPNCQQCMCALPIEDDAAMLVCDLLDAFAVNGFEQVLEEGESQLVDRARDWLANRPIDGHNGTKLTGAPPNEHGEANAD